MTTVSRQDFNEWLKNPLTKVIQELMRTELKDCVDKIASDEMMLHPSYSLLAAKWSGMITIYDNFLNINFDVIRHDGYAEEEEEKETEENV